jgi:superfamily I DNA/RNA helicase
MEISKLQEQIITTNEPKVVVDSAAASGKTEILTRRIQFLLDSGIDPSKIVAITFTNNAASEMYERLGRPAGLFIGTVHSYCNFLLMSSGIDTRGLLNDEKFDELFPLIQSHPECIRSVEHLLVDEAQDSTKEQFEFFELINPQNFMYFGDARQSIYSFNGADPDYLVELTQDPSITVFQMKQNYRNYREILTFAKKFLFRLGSLYSDDSIPMRGGSYGCVLEDSLTPEETVTLFEKVQGYLKDDWKDWFILCRTNADVDLFSKLLTKRDIPNDTFKQADLTSKEIRERMEQNTVKVLTVHSAKGLENKNVLVYNVRAYKDEEARVCYVAATRARNHLIWIKAPTKKRKTKVVNWE